MLVTKFVIIPDSSTLYTNEEVNAMYLGTASLQIELQYCTDEDVSDLYKQLMGLSDEDPSI